MRASKPWLIPAALAAAASFAVLAADHAESPGTEVDPAADIADVYVFVSPEAANRVVGSITFGSRPAPRSRIDGTFYCDRDVLYTFAIDRADAAGNFDGNPDVRVYIRFGQNGVAACGVQFENVPGAGGTFSGPIERVLTANSGGLRGFAGLRNDPFFFDAEGFTTLLNTFGGAGQSGDVVTAFRLTGGQPRRDSFAGRNISAVVFEMDLDAVAPRAANGTRPKLRVWATTSRIAG